VVRQVGIAFVDKDYPARAAFGIVTKVLEEYSAQSRDAWRTLSADANDAGPLLEDAVRKYQASLQVMMQSASRSERPTMSLAHVNTSGPLVHVCTGKASIHV
jgi:hypothetical protein